MWRYVHETIQLLSPGRQQGSPSSCCIWRKEIPGWKELGNENKTQQRTSRRVCAPSVSILAPLERVGKGFDGAITFFQALGPSWPKSPFACDLGKGIIRGRDGGQRPVEMNSGAPDSHCGGMKGG